MSSKFLIKVAFCIRPPFESTFANNCIIVFPIKNLDRENNKWHEIEIHFHIDGNFLHADSDGVTLLDILQPQIYTFNMDFLIISRYAGV